MSDQELLVTDNGVIAKTELDKNVTTAKAYPRNLQTAMDYAYQLATMDEATAQSCFYCLPRKDKTTGQNKEIRGASIRLAEIMATAWGNLRLRTRTVSNNGRVITAAGRAWDLQTNNDVEMEHEVSIWFGEKAGKGGYQANADMQTMLSNAAKAKALRNAIFKVIPKALVDRVLERAMSFSVGDQKTVASKLADLVDKLVKMGVDKDKMLAYYGHENISQITPEEFKSLIGVGTAIKEGYIKIEEVFSVESENDENSMSAAEKVNNLIHSKKHNPETGELNG